MKRKTFLIPSTFAVSQFLGAGGERKQAIRSDRNFKQSRSSLIIEGVVVVERRQRGVARRIWRWRGAGGISRRVQYFPYFQHWLLHEKVSKDPSRKLFLLSIATNGMSWVLMGSFYFAAEILVPDCFIELRLRRGWNLLGITTISWWKLCGFYKKI